MDSMSDFSAAKRLACRHTYHDTWAFAFAYGCKVYVYLSCGVRARVSVSCLHTQTTHARTGFLRSYRDVSGDDFTNHTDNYTLSISL